jgi:hypothetical protein
MEEVEIVSEIQQKKHTWVKVCFLIVYIAIAIATAYHTAWGFATIDGLPDKLTENALRWWWGIGILSAFSVDIGMAVIVYILVSGYQSKWLSWSLFVLALFSLYAQLMYAAHHATDISSVQGTKEIHDFMQTLLNIRVFVMPFCLPTFSLVYAFAAKSGVNETSYADMENMVETYKAGDKRDKEWIKSLQDELKKAKEETEKAKNSNTVVTASKELDHLGKFVCSTDSGKKEAFLLKIQNNLYYFTFIGELPMFKQNEKYNFENSLSRLSLTFAKVESGNQVQFIFVLNQ